jgi:hypothetical protein
MPHVGRSQRSSNAHFQSFCANSKQGYYCIVGTPPPRTCKWPIRSQPTYAYYWLHRCWGLTHTKSIAGPVRPTRLALRVIAPAAKAYLRSTVRIAVALRPTRPALSDPHLP